MVGLFVTSCAQIIHMFLAHRFLRCKQHDLTFILFDLNDIIYLILFGFLCKQILRQFFTWMFDARRLLHNNLFDCLSVDKRDRALLFYVVLL